MYKPSKNKGVIKQNKEPFLWPTMYIHYCFKRSCR